MTDLNRVFLVGRVVRDAELKYTQSNQAVCTFDLAINTRKKQGEEWHDDTLFLNRVAFWGERGEKIAERLTKGVLVFVEGRLRMDEWEKDGQKRRELKIVAFNVQFLSSPKAEGGAGAFKDEAFEKPDADLASDDDLPF